MAGGIVINGKFVARPGVYANVRYIPIPGAPTQGGVLAVVGEFPFLKQNTPYISTSQRAFESIAVSNPTLMRMSNIIYSPFRQAAFAGSPTQVVLMSPMPTTQAFGMLRDSANADSIRIASRIWGPQGNRTLFRIVPNAAIGGWDVRVTNDGTTENIRVPAEPAPATFSYAYPTPAPSPAPATPHTSEGFGVWLSDTGSVTRGEVTSSGIDFTFSKVLLDECVADVVADPGHISWLPNGPVTGVLSVTGAGALSGGLLTAIISGIDEATGLPDTDTITFSVAECLAVTAKPTTVTWASVSSVACFTAGGQTLAGSVTIAGANFPTLNAANGQTTVAAAIRFIAQYATAGFISSTSSTRTASILLADLDESTVAPLPLSLSADSWKIVTTVNASSLFVELEDVGPLAPDVPVNGTFFFLVGGSQSVVTSQDWGDALEELRWYDVDELHAFYDPTGVLPFGDAVLPLFFDHVNTMWGDGANERTLWVGAGENETYSTLVQRSALFNSERVNVVIDSANITQYQGATEQMRPYWYALMHAAAASSIPGVGSLTRAQLRVNGVSRNASLYSNEMVNELLRAGLIMTSVPPGGFPRVEREVTTWTVDNNVAQTEAICTRSVRESIKDMRAALDVLLSPEASTTIIVLADVQAMVEGRLEAQKASQAPLITDYDRQSITIRELADRFDIGYRIVCRVNKNFIVLDVGVSVPTGTI
jgi:hypothetical protein